MDSAQGDPQINTFDGSYVAFMGKCKYETITTNCTNTNMVSLN